MTARINPLGRAAYHMVGTVLAISFIAPLAWAFLSSLKPAAEARKPPLPPWPTSGMTVENYISLDGYGAGFWTHASNSLIVSVGTVLLTVVISVLAGYGFSRFRFPLKGLFFVLILSKVGLQNNLFGLILIYVTLQLPFSIFMMRNAFDAVPIEIEEAARVDGASVLTVLARVMMPLVAPGVISVAIFAFLAAWNEFLAALIFLTDQDSYTLPVLIVAVRSGRYGSIDWGAVQSGVTVMMIPCVILFLLLQRYYVRGLTAGAVK